MHSENTNSTLFGFFLFFEWEIFSYCKSKRKNLSTPKGEKKWTDYFFKFYNEQNAHYYLENTGKILKNIYTE